MRSTWIVIVLIICAVCLHTREGVTSQVHIMDSGESLPNIVSSASIILVVKPLGKIETYRKETIKVPGKSDVTYEEMVDLYEVVSPIKSDRLKAGETIKIWTAPAYSFEMTKAYYQTGESESPIVRQYKASSPIIDGQNRIIFLNDKEPDKSVYTYRAAEGMEALNKIEALLGRDK